MIIHDACFLKVSNDSFYKNRFLDFSPTANFKPPFLLQYLGPYDSRPRYLLACSGQPVSIIFNSIIETRAYCSIRN